MVGIGLPPRVADRLAQAVHGRLARPVEGGQLARRLQRVRLGIGGHLQPVDAAHVFAPAQDLPHEPLDGVKRRRCRPA